MARTLNETDRKILELAKAEDPNPRKGVNLLVYYVHRDGETYEVRHTLGYHTYIHVFKGERNEGGEQVFDRAAWLDRITTTDVDRVLDALTAALRDIVGDEEILEVSAENYGDTLVFETNLRMDYLTGSITRPTNTGA